MFEVNVKKHDGRGGGGRRTQLGFWVLIKEDMHLHYIIVGFEYFVIV